MRYEQIEVTEAYRKANPADLATNDEAFHSAASTPDMPSAVGKMIVASYIALLGMFAVTMTGSRLSIFSVVIGFIFLFMYLGVPTVLLKTEPKRDQRPSFDHFLQKGIQTYTGPMSGKDVLMQMLLVPVLLTACALTIGIVAMSTL
jgi:small-conductance mechanosensitive channel